jgi:VanZ family protein
MRLRPLIIWLVMVFVLSVYPFKDMGGLSLSYGDKVLHFIIYAITGALLYRVLTDSRGKVLRTYAFVLALLLASGYGLGMEFAQDFVGYRSFSLWDEAVNVLGALAAVSYMKFIRRVK